MTWVFASLFLYCLVSASSLLVLPLFYRSTNKIAGSLLVKDPAPGYDLGRPVKMI